jgi:AcrR family transcriptional regulator
VTLYSKPLGSKVIIIGLVDRDVMTLSHSGEGLSAVRGRKIVDGVSIEVTGTKAKILAASRDLFNEEGFGALAAVDVANALSMSPGHLYYHYKGKGEIATALLDAHAHELHSIASAAIDKCTRQGATIEDVWTWVHILVEEAWDARFAYREPFSILRTDPKLAVLMRNIFNIQQTAASGLLHALRHDGVIKASDEALDGLIAQLALGLSFQLVRLEFEAHGTETPRDLIARAAALIVLPITGFIV